MMYHIQFLFYYGDILIIMVVEIYIFLKKKMNSDKYIDILNIYYLPFNDNSSILQFDNDLKHMSVKSLTYLFNNNIIALEWWPPNSPDLNPIENVWNYIKNKLKKEQITLF